MICLPESLSILHGSRYNLFLAMETQNWEADVTISALLSVFSLLLSQICFQPVCLQILLPKIILCEVTGTQGPEKESKLRMTEGADERQSAGESKASDVICLACA